MDGTQRKHSISHASTQAPELTDGHSHNLTRNHAGATPAPRSLQAQPGKVQPTAPFVVRQPEESIRRRRLPCPCRTPLSQQVVDRLAQVEQVSFGTVRVIAVPQFGEGFGLGSALLHLFPEMDLFLLLLRG